MAVLNFLGYTRLTSAAPEHEKMRFFWPILLPIFNTIIIKKCMKDLKESKLAKNATEEQDFEL